MVTEPFDNWTTQLRKGLLELCILNSIRKDRLYGYDIVRKLRAVPGLVVSEGTIYPILSRFKRQGLVRTSVEESPEGPPRKYYRLTEHGENLLKAMNEYWDAVSAGADAIQRGDDR